MSVDLDKALRKGDEFEILDALFKLGGTHKKQDERTIDHVISLISSRNEDICERAVFVAGIRHKWVESFDPIRKGLADPDASTEYCQLSMVQGIGSLARKYPDLEKECVKVLALVAKSDRYRDAPRGLAYKELCTVFGRITPAQFAVAPNSFRELDVDEEWLSRF